MSKINNRIFIKFLPLLAGSLIWPVFTLITIYPFVSSAQVLPPSVNIWANGNDGVVSVSYNSSVTITWSSSNAYDCVVGGVGWRGPSGTQVIGNLTYDVSFDIGCSGQGGTTSDRVTILVSKQPNPSYPQSSPPSQPYSGQTTYTSGAGSPRFGAGCATSPTTAEVGSSVFLAASSANGINPITYRWGGDVSGGGPTLTTSFSSTGNKIISVVATDSQGKNADASCSVNVVPASPKVAPAPAPSPAPSPAPKPVVTTASNTATDSAGSPQADYDKICREMGYVKPDDVELAENSEEESAVSDENQSNKRSLLASIFFTDSGYPSWLFFAILVLTILFILTLTKLMNGKKQKQEIPTGQVKK